MIDPVRRFTTKGQEAETLCRGCGYNTTDEERKFYGQIIKDDEGNITKQYHCCTFCVEDAAFKKKWFGSTDYKIHKAKVKLARTCVLTGDHLRIVKRIMNLEQDHWDDINHSPYKEDDDGKRIYNQYEAEWNSLQKELSDLRNCPRHLYLEALEEFGGVSDEPPCTRNLTKKQKKKLLKKLKAAISAS